MPSYLHTLRSVSQTLSKMKTMVSIIMTTGTLALTGCSSVAQTDAHPITPQPVSQGSTQDAETIQALLEAEFTLQREGANEAFLPFYKIAKKTRDKALTERLIHIAIASQNNLNIEKSTNLLISISPNDEQAYALKLQVLLQAKRADDAATLLSQAIDRRISIRFLPLFIDKNIRDNDLMNTIATALAKLPTKQHDNLFIKASDARVQFNAGNYDAAIKLSQYLLNQSEVTDKEPLYLILAYSQDQLGHQNKAITAIETGRKIYPKSARLLTPLLDFFVQSSQIDKAIKTYQDAALSPSSRIQAGISFSNTLLSSGHPDVALTVLNQLPARHYGFEDQVYYLKANALSDLGNKDQAIREMEKVSGILSTHATNQIALWLYAEHREKLINAMVLRRTSREHIPEVVSAICQLHTDNNHNDLALDLLNRTLRMHPQSDAIRYRKALLDDSMGNWKGAITELKTLLDKDQNNAQYLNALGYTLLIRTDRTKEAMDYIEKAYQVNPEDPAIIDSLGWGFFLQGKLTRASFYLKKAWNTLHDAEIAAHYGEALWKQKAYKQAVEIWQTALNDNPTNTLLLDTVKRLNPSLLEKSTKDNE